MSKTVEQISARKTTVEYVRIKDFFSDVQISPYQYFTHYSKNVILLFNGLCKVTFNYCIIETSYAFIQKIKP